MYLIYDEFDNAPTIFRPNELKKVAGFLNLTLASIRSYISKKRSLKNHMTLYKIDGNGKLIKIL